MHSRKWKKNVGLSQKAAHNVKRKRDMGLPAFLNAGPGQKLVLLSRNKRVWVMECRKKIVKQ